MSITHDTAILIDTLARAASQIGSTRASAKINEVICDLLPNTSTEQISALEASERVMSANLELLRIRIGQISKIATDALAEGGTADFEVIQNILAIAGSVPDEPAT